VILFHLYINFNLQVALDYIGKRGATVGVTKEKRIKWVELYFYKNKNDLFAPIMKQLLHLYHNLQVCKGHPSKGDASTCWCWRVLRDKKSVLFWVSLLHVSSCYFNFLVFIMLIIAPQIYHSPATSVCTWAEGWRW
jgi:hypothetical protein